MQLRQSMSRRSLSWKHPTRLPLLCRRCRQDVLRTSSENATPAQAPLRQSRQQSSWAQAVAATQDILNGDRNPDSRLAGISVDPFRVVGKEMKFLTKNLRQLLGSGHPVLDTVAKYYAQSQGKHIRPLLVLLMSRATKHSGTVARPNMSSSPLTSDASFPSQSLVDKPISPHNILSDVNPSAPSSTDSSTSNDDILPSQRRLAEITELIHTASLLHDDVIDTSLTRRSQPSANVAFGNKMAVLAGDFLLGRASVALARLRDAQVTELLASVIANLVEGEFMQLRNTPLESHDNSTPEPVYTDATLSYYLQKTYLKSASLISKSCRAAALLGHHPGDVVDAAYSYGRNLGLAFQLVDDMLDYTTPDTSSSASTSEDGSSNVLGKPAGADLTLGLATAPLLFAWKNNPSLGALVARKFSGPDDVQRARDVVSRSDGVEQTRALAQRYADQAEHAIRDFPESEARSGLVEMCATVMSRKS